MTALEFRHVTMTYGQGSTACTALNDLSLSVEQGEFVCIMGASGSGKTTILHLSAGLCRPTTGGIELLGNSLVKLRESVLARIRRERIGFVFQTLNLLPTMTAWQNVELPLVVNGQATPQRTRRTERLLQISGLTDKATAYPDALSNGQRQQLAVLRAVAHQPEIVFMDEPTSSLDSARASILLDLIAELNQSEGTTIVLTTHDPLIAERSSRKLHLRDGTLIDAE